MWQTPFVDSLKKIYGGEHTIQATNTKQYKKKAWIEP